MPGNDSRADGMAATTDVEPMHEGSGNPGRRRSRLIRSVATAVVVIVLGAGVVLAARHRAESPQLIGALDHVAAGAPSTTSSSSAPSSSSSESTTSINDSVSPLDIIADTVTPTSSTTTAPASSRTSSAPSSETPDRASPTTMFSDANAGGSSSEATTTTTTEPTIPDCQPGDMQTGYAPEATVHVGDRWVASFWKVSSSDHDCVWNGTTWRVSVTDANGTEVYHEEYSLPDVRVLTPHQSLFMDGGPIWVTSCVDFVQPVRVSSCVPAVEGTYHVAFTAYGFDHADTVTVIP
jgi:hypothetical protein